MVEKMHRVFVYMMSHYQVSRDATFKGGAALKDESYDDKKSSATQVSKNATFFLKAAHGIISHKHAYYMQDKNPVWEFLLVNLLLTLISADHSA